MELHDDVLPLIFQYLDVQSIPKVALVCKRWQEATRDEMMWMNWCARDFSMRTEAVPVEENGWVKAYQKLLQVRFLPHLSTASCFFEEDAHVLSMLAQYKQANAVLREMNNNVFRFQVIFEEEPSSRNLNITIGTQQQLQPKRAGWNSYGSLFFHPQSCSFITAVPYTIQDATSVDELEELLSSTPTGAVQFVSPSFRWSGQMQAVQVVVNLQATHSYFSVYVDGEYYGSSFHVARQVQVAIDVFVNLQRIRVAPLPADMKLAPAPFCPL